jgi:hypothetical protein
VSSKNWNRLIFFAAGTFLGGYVLGLAGGLLGRK